MHSTISIALDSLKRLLLILLTSIVFISIIGAIYPSFGEPMFTSSVSASGDIGIVRWSTSEFWNLNEQDVFRPLGENHGYTHTAITMQQGETEFYAIHNTYSTHSELDAYLFTDTNVITQDRGYLHQSIVNPFSLDCDVLLMGNLEGVNGEKNHLHAKLWIDTLNKGEIKHTVGIMSGSAGLGISLEREQTDASFIVGSFDGHIRMRQAEDTVAKRDRSEQIINQWDIFWQKIGTKKTTTSIQYGLIT